MRAKNRLIREVQTLSVHEIRDGERVVLLHVNVRTLEDSLRVCLRAGAEVLLTKAADLCLNRNSLLRCELISIESNPKPLEDMNTHQLLGERDLLELHLVDSGLCGAEQHSCGTK